MSASHKEHPGASGGRSPLAFAALLAVVVLSAAVISASGPAAAGAGTGGTGCGKSGGLDSRGKKGIAMKLVSSAENSTLDWKAQYGYLDYNVEGNRTDNRGYTGGIIGSTSKTGDMLELLRHYRSTRPRNALSRYIPAMRRARGTVRIKGLGAGFRGAWRKSSRHHAFRRAQDHERDLRYFCPAVRRAKSDGLGPLGQFIYYDAIVVHGPGKGRDSFGGIRAGAVRRAATPARGGDESNYLDHFLDVRVAAMRREAAHRDVSRIETEQRVFLDAGNLALHLPLRWQTYGDRYSIGG